MGNASSVRRKHVSNSAKVGYLASWPGSVLEWSNGDLSEFAKCFTGLKVGAGKEISFNDPRSFFIVADGSVEIQAILPTIRKKTGNIREFLCKKDTGDMVYMPAMRKLIAESNRKEIYERENIENKEHGKHKKMTNVVDTISIKAINESTILQLDWKRFDNIFCEGVNTPESVSKIDIGMLRAVMETNLTDYLEKMPVLAEIPHTKLETFVRMCHYRVNKKGSVICREGDVGEEVFIILSGEVKVEAMASERMVELLKNPNDLVDMVSSMRSIAPNQSGRSFLIDAPSPILSDKKSRRSVSFEMPDEKEKKNGQAKYNSRRRTLFMATQVGRREMMKNQSVNDKNKRTASIELARLNAGDYFGEMATFIELPRAATVTATSNLLMASLSKTNFRILYNTISPDLQEDVEELVKKHMIQNIFQLRCPFLNQTSVEQTNAMAELTTIKSLDSEKVVFKQDDDAHAFYFVYSGTLKVTKTKNNGEVQKVANLYSGDYFGELAVINNSKRLATISTVTKTVLVELTGENFHKCFQDKPELISEFILRMKGRLVDLKTLMNHKLSKQVFSEFLDLEHGKENILFYDAAEEYKTHFDKWTEDEKEEKATFIVKDYLSSRGEDAVNVPCSMYEAATKVLETKDFKKDSFEQPQEEIFKLMDRDLFARFRKSSAYTALMDKVRSYDDLEVQLNT